MSSNSVFDLSAYDWYETALAVGYHGGWGVR